MANSRRKVLVLGLDGASPLLVDRWIGELPTFRRFRNNGFLGESIPPIPAQTPVAWTTFMTGKNPGKHGIFSFMQRVIGSYERQIANPRLVAAKTLWQILSEHKRRVGVVNVPMSSYKQVNGFMIPGFLDKDEGVAQPQSIREKLRRRFNVDSFLGDVESETLLKARTNPQMLLDRIFEITEGLAEVSLYLLENMAWDFFMTVFMGTDRVGHFFWKYVDRNHPDYAINEFDGLIQRYYRMVDNIISRFLKSIPEETLVVLVSDHGFCPISREVFLNNYLEEFGYLQRRNGKVNLYASQAIAYGYGDLWLNVKGREPRGIVEKGRAYEKVRDDIIDSLEDLRITGARPIQKVARREEIYHGPYVSAAPDLTAIFKTGWQAARRPEIVEKRGNGCYINDDPLWSGGHDGTHNPQAVPGILGFLSPNLLKNSLPSRAYLWDLAPTILMTMNVPIPRDMDGNALDIIE